MARMHELTACVRTLGAKGAVRALRRRNSIPAIIYGGNEKPEPVTLDYREVLKEIKAGRFASHIYNVKLGDRSERVIPREVQFEPVRDSILHVDLMRLTKGATVSVAVSVQFVNEEDSPGLKRGGVLNIVRHEVDLECPNDAIPEKIVADLKGLTIGDSIHISSVALPENASPTIADRDFTIATIAAPAGLRSEQDAEEAEAEPDDEQTDDNQ
ncbi:MAG: 50S ribosomal protein L25/general stress protein Ctc [Hyphomicrobiales bacterium]